MIDRYSHADNVRERVDFLNFILTNAAPTYRLPIEFIYKLWGMLYENPISYNDSQVLFEFLKDIASNQEMVL